MFPVLLLSLLSAEPAAAALPALQDPPIRISINNDRRFVRGDRAKVKVRVEDDGFLLVLHADTDGRLRVLFPLDPDDDNFVRGNRTYEIRGRGDRESFTADGTSGEGAVYAAISRDPFRFDDYVANRHWDFRALDERGLPDNPEPELTELARRMSPGQLEYDYLTYRVSRYDDVAYAPSVAYRSNYADPFCGSSYYFRYGCDPYYYSPSRSSLYINFGSPYGYGHYDPYYYGASYYDPYYWTRPYSPYGYYGRPRSGYPSYPYANSPSYPYRPRSVSPGGFKQTNRLWDGTNYRDRTAGATEVRATHTVYGEPPVRRTVSQGDPGKSPLTPSPSRELSDRPSRRQVERTAKLEQPAPVRRGIEEVREPELRRREKLTEDERETPRPNIERAPERRSEPVRMERPRPEPTRMEPSRAEPARAAPQRSEPTRESSSDGGGRRTN